MLLTRRRILGITAAAAVAVRLLFLLEWVDSPYRCFHRVPGLDMETLLRMSEWGGGANFPPIFTFHRVLIHLIWRFHGFRHSVEALFAVQSLLGVAAAVLVADLALTLYRKRGAALVVGLVAASYVPFLFYEFAVLQESSTLFLVLAAFWLLLKARRRAFAPRRSLAAGAALAFASLGRPVVLLFALAALPWGAVWLRRKKLPPRRLAPLAAGLALVFGLAALFNGIANGDPSPFFKVMPHALSAEAGNVARTEAAPSPESGWNALAERDLIGVLCYLLPLEFPENLNCTYLCRKFSVTDYLPGLRLVMLFALPGLFLLFNSGEWRRRPGWLLLPLVTLILPLAARGPIERYRLIMIPYFMLAIPMFFQLKHRRVLRLTGAVVFTVAFCYCFLPNCISNRVRDAADNFTWALAAEARNGGIPDEETLDHMQRAWYRYSDETKYPVSLALRLLKLGDTAAAEAVLTSAAYGDERPAPVCRYYLGVLRFERGDFAAAEEELAESIPEKLPESLRFKYFFMRSECAARRGDTAAAADFARRALALPGGTSAMRTLLQRRLPPAH